jgi:hypothetical protein
MITRAVYWRLFRASTRKIARFLAMPESNLFALVATHCRRYGVEPHEGLRAVRYAVYAQLTRG